MCNDKLRIEITGKGCVIGYGSFLDKVTASRVIQKVIAFYEITWVFVIFTKSFHNILSQTNPVHTVTR